MNYKKTKFFNIFLCFCLLIFGSLFYLCVLADKTLSTQKEIASDFFKKRNETVFHVLKVKNHDGGYIEVLTNKGSYRTFFDNYWTFEVGNMYKVVSIKEINLLDEEKNKK